MSVLVPARMLVLVPVRCAVAVHSTRLYAIRCILPASHPSLYSSILTVTQTTDRSVSISSPYRRPFYSIPLPFSSRLLRPLSLSSTDSFVPSTYLLALAALVFLFISHPRPIRSPCCCRSILLISLPFPICTSPYSPLFLNSPSSTTTHHSREHRPKFQGPISLSNPAQYKPWSLRCVARLLCHSPSAPPGQAAAVAAAASVYDPSEIVCTQSTELGQTCSALHPPTHLAWAPLVRLRR